MKLTNKNWQKIIEFKENEINTVIIENKLYFREMLVELLKNKSGDTSDFSISENGKYLDFEKNADIIFDFFNLDCNSKRINTRILNNLSSIALENYEHTLTIKNNLIQYFSDLAFHCEYGLDFEHDIELLNILKLANFKIESSSNCFIDNILVYLKTLSHIVNYKLIIMINPRLYFSDEELFDIYQFVMMNKIMILNIEYRFSHNHYNKICPFENFIIFDNDLCEIY